VKPKINELIWMIVRRYIVWRDELKRNVVSMKEINSHIHYTKKELEQLKKLVVRHPMSISRHYFDLIDFDNPYDPLRKIVIPSLAEMDLSGSYDTSGEKQDTKFYGVQHKYAETALILITNKCSSYCRFCFRKRLVGIETNEVLSNISKAAEYIKEHKEINNVLISGGDPFMLDTEIIAEMLYALADIKHLDYVRIGSKMPVFYPQRFTNDQAVIDLLASYSQKHHQIYLVSHIDHINEITPETEEAVNLLLKAGVIINNQTVLLKGVNDDATTLADLMKRLVGIGVNPYYVFQCRPVKRVKANFQISLIDGIRIVETAKAQLDGHSKRFKYVMSHKTGKIEILGTMEKEIYFKYHEAHNPKKLGKIFKLKIDEKLAWLDMPKV